MKKIVSLLLCLVLTISVLSIVTFAEENIPNLLDEDASCFEGGTLSKYWTALGGGTVEIADNPAGEGKVLKYSGADKSYSTPQLDLRPILQSKIKSGETIYYKMSVYVEGGGGSSTMRLRDTKSLLSCLEGKQYTSLGNVTLDENAWTTVSGSFDISDEDLALTDGGWNLCFDGIMSKITAIYVDNVYITEDEVEDAAVDDKTVPEKTDITRSEDMLIGTIRWDAFEETTPTGTDPCSQVARVISPAKYHQLAPFFANIEADGSVSFPEYTVKTWEQEAAYAVEGGLDYFAYLWYDSTDIMSKPRKLHLQSEKKDTIKMCGILEKIRGTKAMEELFSAMKDSCYLRLNNRPVVFLYGLNGKNWTNKDIAQLRQDAANAGITESLYLIGMDMNKNNFLTSTGKDIDAISWYSVGAEQTGETYASLASRCEQAIKDIGGMCKTTAGRVNIVPSFTAGRYDLPRIETKVSWIDGDPNAEKDEDKPYGNKYALLPTMDEFKAHIINVLSYVNEHTDVTVPNMVCSYGWNEHEEGGWLCPTLAVDENGNQLYNEDGTKKINTERIDTLKAAIEAFTASLNNNGTSTGNETNVAENGETKGNFNVLYVVIPVGIVVVAGICVVTVVLKKKKKPEDK